jgi:hypothetical protein
LLDGREREWLSKAPAHALRLAGTLEFLAWSFGSGAEPTEISVETMTAAVELTYEYFWPHSRAALRQIGVCERHADARAVLKWIKATRREVLSREEVRREALSQRLDAEQTNGLLEKLVKSGWLRPAEPAPREGPGRKARRWAANPKLFQ